MAALRWQAVRASFPPEELLIAGRQGNGRVLSAQLLHCLTLPLFWRSDEQQDAPALEDALLGDARELEGLGFRV